MDIPIPTQEKDISVPLISNTYNGAQAAAPAAVVLHQNHHPIPPALPPPASNNESEQVAISPRHHDVVKYRECLKNHAAGMGGNATDGCGEFLPSGEQGTIEALICSACNCHRNFHRKDHHWGPPPYGHSPHHLNRLGRKVILGGGGGGSHHIHDQALVYPTGMTGSRVATPQQMIMPYNMATHESDEDGRVRVMVRQAAAAPMTHHRHHQQQQVIIKKKRFRTKFTQEQKEKMLNFAVKVGWKIQSQEESLVHNFCQEIGVKRRVLKVWMHNNKHHHTPSNINNIINP